MNRFPLVLFGILIGISFTFLFLDRTKKGSEQAVHLSGENREERVYGDGNRKLHPLQEELSKEVIISLTNRIRLANGVSELAESTLLNRVALARVRDIFEKQYLDHVSPTGESYSDVAQRVGYPYKFLSENIESGFFLTNQKVIDGWMQSPGHRRNLLSGDMEEIGVAVQSGVLHGEKTWIAVQIFGKKSPVQDEASTPRVMTRCQVPDESIKEKIATAKSEVESADNLLSSLSYEIEIEKIQMGRMREVSREKATSHNARVRRYNDLLFETNVRKKNLLMLLNRYNEEVKRYNTCVGQGRSVAR